MSKTYTDERSPAPWTAREIREEDAGYEWVRHEICDADGHRVARTVGTIEEPGDPTTSEPDARLLAAAPDLLAALERFVATESSGTLDDAWYDERDRALTLARAAIAKATPAE